ncbi:MAG: hypothetical protein ACOZFS_01280 [Thermodesulfobacteriota bacterium]
MSRKHIIWLALRGFVLMLAGSLVMACATSTAPVTFQPPKEVQTKTVLETCALVSDQELAEMRGCYDVYSFAMSIKGDLDLAAKNFAIQTNYTQVIDAASIPSNLIVNSSGSLVSYNNGSMSFTAGVGQNSLGSGIMQVVQAVGQNIIVVASMDVTLNINNAVNLKPVAGNTLTTPSTLSGIYR